MKRTKAHLRIVAAALCLAPAVGWPHGAVEHVDEAILPDIKTKNGTAYVSLPHNGRIAVVDLETAEIVRSLDVGGEPTRIVLVHVGGKEEPTIATVTEPRPLIHSHGGQDHGRSHD